MDLLFRLNGPRVDWLQRGLRHPTRGGLLGIFVLSLSNVEQATIGDKVALNRRERERYIDREIERTVVAYCRNIFLCVHHYKLSASQVFCINYCMRRADHPALDWHLVTKETGRHQWKYYLKTPLALLRSFYNCQQSVTAAYFRGRESRSQGPLEKSHVLSFDL